MTIFKIELVVYRPYTQEVHIEAESSDTAIDFALAQKIDNEKWIAQGDLSDLEIDVNNINPIFFPDDKDEDDED